MSGTIDNSGRNNNYHSNNKKGPSPFAACWPRRRPLQAAVENNGVGSRQDGNVGGGSSNNNERRPAAVNGQSTEVFCDARNSHSNDSNSSHATAVSNRDSYNNNNDCNSCNVDVHPATENTDSRMLRKKSIVSPRLLKAPKEREKPDDAAILLRLTKGDEVTIIDKWGKQKSRVLFVDDRTTVLRKFSKSMFAPDGTKRVIGLREVSNIIDGAHTEAFQRNALTEKASCCFSLVFDNGCKTIDILCSDPNTKKTWVHGLTLIISRLMPSMQTADDIAQCYFQLADVNHDGRLSVDEVCSLLKRLHVSLDRQYVKQLFELVETDSDTADQDNQLDRREFLQFVKILYHCKEIEAIYDSAKGGNEYLNASNFAGFLSAHQKQYLPLEEVERLMENSELSVSMRGMTLLSYEGFRSYLMSEENSLIKPEATTVYQDMTQPLTSYWIYSSHNTYLTGNQLTGQSSTNAYTAALTRGCRCVEIDSWDGDDGEPIVTHGRTLTSKLLFRDVITAIKTAAFTSSPYPVIVSIENHCSINQQRKMTEHMVNIFGDALCTSLYNPANPSEMLSPKALMSKFLIKGKILKSHHAFSGPSDTDDTEAPADDLAANEDSSGKDSGKHQAKVAKELSDITAIPSVSMPKLEQALPPKSLPFGAVSSLVESDIAALSEKNLHHLVNYTKKYFVRVYPAGLRTGSSNYNPMLGLIGGCQLVALNLQTPDKYFKTYNGFFSDNGYCGYILKNLEPALSPPMTLQINVISGYQLGKAGQVNVRDILDPYIIVRICGTTADEATFQTTVVKDNGFNPIWNETFTFRISRPDVALLRFVVMDQNSTLSSNDYVAQYTTPIRLLRQGFRYARLDSENSSCSSLLVRVTIA